MLQQLDASHRIRLRMFDTVLELASDDPAYFAEFAYIYRNFLVDAGDTSAVDLLRAAVLRRGDRGQSPALMMPGQVWPLSDPTQLKPFVYEQILNMAAANVQSHLLFHAGVIAHDGQATVILADSQHGKTTLVLSLIRLGFEFLSDELAAIQRTTGWVDPFPRLLQVRSGSLELAGYPNTVDHAVRWQDKLLLDVAHLHATRAQNAATIRNIILLVDPDSPEVGRKIDGGQDPTLLVTLDRMDEAVVASLRGLDTVQKIDIGSAYGYPLLKLHTPDRAGVTLAVEQFCQREGVLVLNIQKREEIQPDFDRPAKLDTLPSTTMVMELLRRFQGTHRSRLLHQGHSGSGVGLFVELADLINTVRCYRLTVGHHAQMAELVASLARETHPSLA